MVNLAIFSSGKGSNTNNICDFFKNSSNVCVGLIVSDKPDNGSQTIAKTWDIPMLDLDAEKRGNPEEVLSILKEYKIDFIILAGYLRLIPKSLIEKYPRKILNIHPALLPDYGGKGMYGMNVHKAVSKAGVTETGITIHYVDENYDEGAIIFQSKITINAHENSSSIAQKINRLELENYPQVILNTINNYKTRNHNND